MSRSASVEAFENLNVHQRWTHVLERRSSILLQGMLMSRRAVSRMGLLATDVYADDYDFMLRVLGHNLKCRFTGEAVAEHRHTRSFLSLEQINRYHHAARIVARRHARSLNELRRAIGVLRFESGAGKVANGHRASGLVDLTTALCLSPLTTARMAVKRLAHRFVASRA
jgi:GT2 family glycosyltransferase